MDRDTRFQIVAEHADAFAPRCPHRQAKEGHISRVGSHSAEDDAAVMETIKTLGTPEHKAERSEMSSDAPEASPSKPAEPRKKDRWRNRDKATSPHGFRKAHQGPKHRTGGGQTPSWQVGHFANSETSLQIRPQEEASSGSWESPSFYTALIVPYSLLK